ncbi:MAG: hypothetical protein SFX73_34725 [Kofleriaceae bacterium]|nr:hypothetical protein [Kofleriaceae bacterium]
MKDSRCTRASSSLRTIAPRSNGCAEHKATFAPKTNEFRELSPNVNNGPTCGVYQIANDPKGGTRGVIYAYRGTEFTALRITTKTTSKMTSRPTTAPCSRSRRSEHQGVSKKERHGSVGRGSSLLFRGGRA